MKTQLEEMPTFLLRNKPLQNFPFKMYDESAQLEGKSNLKVKAERSLHGRKFESCVCTPTEVGYGWYKIDLSAEDLSKKTVVFRFLAEGAIPTYITVETIKEIDDGKSQEKENRG